MESAKKYINGFLALISFVTIIPTGVYDVSAAAEYFYLIPLIGFIEGLTVVPLIFIPVTSLLKAILILLILYIITGLIHIDGFTDFIDTLASRKTGEEALKIMKEPCRGAIAIVSDILLILITYISLIIVTNDEYNWYIILLSQTFAFESMFLLAIISESPKYEGLGKLFITKAKDIKKDLVNILLLVVLLFIAIYNINIMKILFLVAMASVTLIILLYTNIKSHKILGYANGDILGFCLELSRSSTLFIISILLALG